MNGSTLTHDAVLLPPGQARILAFVQAYYAVAKEGCPARIVARRLERHPETIREQFAVLHQKGWLKTRSSPATPTDRARRLRIIRLPR
jgi:hypothetical protein